MSGSQAGLWFLAGLFTALAAVVVLCLLPEISTYLPDLVMGPDGGR